ncbi:MAG: trypsin-like peptidase domain-containing protein [Chitinophagaceae bacterium]|nr:trypsin-like peptidase domain-containing protein [Chitinophagaceae bacterium]
MKNNSKILVIAMAVMIVIGGWGVYANHRTVRNSILQAEPALVHRAGYANTGQFTPPDFEKAAESSVASVVHIKTVTQYAKASGGRQQQNPFGDFFGNDDLFRRFFGEIGPAVKPETRASGSGVVISSDGYIVTNNHVVNGATEISVTMPDRKSYKAKVIGTDANTDLALIRIDAKNLPVMPVGNSDDVHLGEWVLAIGYPLNLDVTVTQGIISAKSRSIGINQEGQAPVESFLQTDAAVNPGNSGGALVNTDGELIGINSAIASPTGAYAGYAYAIPSNLMKKVIGDIMKYGSVQRGYLGISMAPENLDDAKKKELGINDDIRGVWVMETDPTGAAAAAGIKKGDAITRVDGKTIDNNSQLSEQIATHKPGDRVAITFTRNKEEKTVNVVLKNKLGTFASQKEAMLESLGAAFTTVKKTDAAKLGIPGGVQVSAIKDGVISDQTTMKPGFVITKVNDAPVKSVDELRAAIARQDNSFMIEGIYPGSDQVYYYGINDFRK